MLHCLHFISIIYCPGSEVYFPVLMPIAIYQNLLIFSPPRKDICRKIISAGFLGSTFIDMTFWCVDYISRGRRVNNKLTAQIGLILVAIIWGTTFILVKQALNDCPPFFFATLRFGLATMLTIALVNRKLFQLTNNEIAGGFVCGFFLFLGYGFQNFGLMHTTASKSAFITSVSVLLVPILL